MQISSDSDEIIELFVKLKFNDERSLGAGTNVPRVLGLMNWLLCIKLHTLNVDGH